MSPRTAGDPEGGAERLAAVKEPLLHLCATYLLDRGDGSEAARDAVASVPSPQWRQAGADPQTGWPIRRRRDSGNRSASWSTTSYEPGAIEGNHQKFVQGSIVASAPRTRARLR